jgi:predicted O-methyltransferase YrrM
MGKITDIIEKYDIDGYGLDDDNSIFIGTDKNTIHSYCDIYEELLSSYINKEVKLLEVGVLYGASALIWYELLPNSKLFLVDIKNWMHQKITKHLNNDRYKFYKMNGYSQYAVNTLKLDVLSGFDIILEDGPHSIETQSIFLKKYFPLLNKDGIMIIEDVEYKNVELLIKQVPSNYRKFVKIYDLRKQKNRYDDILFVIQKP